MMTEWSSTTEEDMAGITIRVTGERKLTTHALEEHVEKEVCVRWSGTGFRMKLHAEKRKSAVNHALA